MKKYCIIGDDKRSAFLRKMFADEGEKITFYDEADYIIAPIPFSRDGKKITGENILIEEFIQKIKGKTLFTGAIKKDLLDKMTGIEVYDLMEYDDIAILNAIPTCEGAIFEAMKNSEITLSGSNVLVTGFGRIGKVLAKMLDGIGCNVHCEARKDSDLAMIKAMGYKSVDLADIEERLPIMDYVFNTIPVMIFDENRLKYLKDNVLIIDLASVPGGVDFEMAEKLKINVVWALSLPSKVAPLSAAKYLKEKIDKLTN